MTPPTSLPAAILGAGLMGGWHADAAARAGGGVVAVYDRDNGRAGRLARRHGARVATSSADAVSGAAVAHVCTPPATHDALAREALAAGAAVLCEKPLAETAEETRALLDAAEAAGRSLVPVHQYVFQPGALEAASLLPSLGTLLHVECYAASAGAEGEGAPSPDEVAASILAHPLSLIARLSPALAEPARWSAERPRAGELRATAGGMPSAAIVISMAARPTANSMRLVGEGGTVHLDLFHGFAVVERGGAATRGAKLARPFAVASRAAGAAGANLARRALRGETAYPGLRELVRRAYDAVRSGGPPPIAAREVLAVAAVRDAILAAAGVRL